MKSSSILIPLTLLLTLMSGACASVHPPEAKARNLILFIGDGMGVSTVTAARIFDGQAQGLQGEEHYLAFERFPQSALIKTYNYDSQVPDSAGTATAIMSGYKARIGTINIRPEDVNAACGDHATPPTLLTRSKASGRAVGIISTTTITHATPAAMYGHTKNRGWEADDQLSETALEQGCTSLAHQLLNSDFDLALGGGRAHFTPDALQHWKRTPNHHLLEDAKALRRTVWQAGDKGLGLFTDSHMSFETDRDTQQEPSLAEMTAFAIGALSHNQQGYVLMVEAGRVDHAHHATNAYRALTDMQAFNEAVKTALNKTGDDTLILVTADHSHVLTIAGYPARGNPILGLVHTLDHETRQRASAPVPDNQGQPYTTLGYQNGPNTRSSSDAIPILTATQVQEKNYRQQTAIPLPYETHSGEDVPLYAQGPGAHKLPAVLDQHEIYKIIMQALDLP